MPRRFDRTTRGWALAVVGTATIACGTVAALVSSGADADPSTESPAPVRAGFQQSAPAVPAPLTDAFSIFRRPPTQDPQSVRASRSWQDRSTISGANPALARVVATPQGTVGVMPGADATLCLRTPLGNPRYPDIYTVGCQPAERAIAGDMVTVNQPRPDVPPLMFGVVPDAVARVTVMQSDGTRVIASLSDNVWTASVSNATSVRLTAADGAPVGAGTVALP